MPVGVGAAASLHGGPAWSHAKPRLPASSQPAADITGHQGGLLCLQGARSARSSLLPSLLLGREGLGLRLGERLGDLWEQRGPKEGVALSSWEERGLFVAMCAAGVGLGGARRAVRARYVCSGPSRLQADQTKRLQASWSTQQRGGSSKREPRSRSAPPAHLAGPACQTASAAGAQV